MKLLNFYRKEINEILRTSKIVVLPAIFLFFGMMSPLFARYQNELLKAMSGSMGGITIKLPAPVVWDSYYQLYKNAFSTLTIVLILIFMGSVAEEKSKGTAMLVLTKGVSRIRFIVSKYFGALTLFTAGYAACLAAFVYYTFILFKTGVGAKEAAAMAIYWIYGCFIISTVIFSSTINKSQMGTAVTGFSLYALVSVLPSFPGFDRYSPGALNAIGLEVVKGTKTIAYMIPACSITIGLSILFTVLSAYCFRNQEL